MIKFFPFCFIFAFNFNLCFYNQVLLRHRRLARRGRAVQVEIMKPKLKLPGTKLLKLRCDILASNSAFKFNLRRYATCYTATPALIDAAERAEEAGAYTRPHLCSV